MLTAFPFYSSLTRLAFSFHIAIRLAYQLFLPLIHSKEISCLRKDHESGEENRFLRFPPPRFISVFSAGIIFPRSLHYVHMTVGIFLGK